MEKNQNQSTTPKKLKCHLSMIEPLSIWTHLVTHVKLTLLKKKKTY